MDSLSGRLERVSLYIALITAWVAMLGSLYFSEVAGYIPCTLCWYQRILMYPLAGILAVGLLRRDLGLPVYVLPFSVLGLFMSSYHYLLQKTDFFGAGICREGVPCSTIWINWLGFITIPFLALTAFLIITVMALIAQTAEEPVLDPDAKVPWVPVVGTIAAVVVAFGMVTRPADLGNSTAQANPIIVETPLAQGELMLDSPSLASGQARYAEVCAVCHGIDRTGITGLGPSLLTSQMVAESSDQEMLAFIRAGRGLDDPANQSGLVMPPSGGRPDLDDETMLAIIEYVKTQ